MEKNEKLYTIIVFAAAILASLAYAYLALSTSPVSGSRILNSPDEMANFYFATNLVEHKKLFGFEPLNVFAQNIIHPRAMTAFEGKLLPVSFVGIILLYGAIGKILGAWIIIYLTILISVAGCMYFYKLIHEIFGKNIAVFSALLMLVFPGWMYYNSRSMFHNVLFVNLFVIGIWYLYKFLKTQELKSAIGAGILLGLTVITRTSEIIWMSIISAALLILFYKSIHPIRLVVLVVAFLFSVMPFFFYNKVAYQSFIDFGYRPAESQQTKEIEETKDEQTGIAPAIFENVFPFGIYPLRAGLNFVRYFPIFLWWYFIPAAIGVLLFFLTWSQNPNSQKIYLILFLFISLYVTIFYGSWRVIDNLDPKKITIGTSYVRYWLPMYIFSLPFCAQFLFWLSERIGYFLKRSKTFMTTLSVLLFLAIAFLSIRITFFVGEESLFAVKRTILQNYEKRNLVASLVESDAIIVADRNDKTFFPDFKVINGFSDRNTIKNVSRLVAYKPVYYYTYFGDDDIERIQQQLSEYDLELIRSTTILNNERLFQVRAIQ